MSVNILHRYEQFTLREQFTRSILHGVNYLHGVNFLQGGYELFTLRELFTRSMNFLHEVRNLYNCKDYTMWSLTGAV